MAESRSPDPVGPVYRNYLGVVVEVLSEDDSTIHILRLRRDGRRMVGRKETSSIGRERFDDIYNLVSPHERRS